MTVVREILWMAAGVVLWTLWAMPFLWVIGHMSP